MLINVKNIANMNEYDHYIEKEVSKKIGLAIRVIANACSGLDQLPSRWNNVILFTVQLKDQVKARKITSSVFFHCKDTLVRYGCGQRPYAHSGVISILDYEGSKYSGANLDKSKPHIHGVIILPDDIDGNVIDMVIASLYQWKETHRSRIQSGKRSVWFERLQDDPLSVPYAPLEDFLVDINQIEISKKKTRAKTEQRYFENDNLNSLVKWLVYSLKYERKRESEPSIHLFPYDLRAVGKPDAPIDKKYQELSDRHERELAARVVYDPKKAAENRSRSSARGTRRRGLYVPKSNPDFLF